MTHQLASKIYGNCFCGDVKFTLQPPLDFCGHCHCQSCRSSHGAAFVTWTSVPKSSFAITAGENHVKWYASSQWIRWGFCDNCGSSMFYQAIEEGHHESPRTDRMYVAAGNLSADFDSLPTAHVSWEERARWMQMHDGLPKHRGKSDEVIVEGSPERIFTGAPWEKSVGYCRAVKKGNQIFVSGTAPIGENGKIHGPNDGYAQAKRCFEIVKSSLAKFGCDLSCVVRTRMYVSDISRWQEYGRAHQEFFGAHPPSTSMVEVKALIDPQMLIEVEADAVV